MTLSGITPARRRALEAIASNAPAPARESNVTDVERGYVYWQSARWLVDHELAYYPSGSTYLAFTHRGRELADQLGLL